MPNSKKIFFIYPKKKSKYAPNFKVITDHSDKTSIWAVFFERTPNGNVLFEIGCCGRSFKKNCIHRGLGKWKIYPTELAECVGSSETSVLFFYLLIGVFLIDRLGRKVLMYIGSVGYIVSLSLVAMAFFFHWQGMAVPIFLFLFIASPAYRCRSVIRLRQLC